MCVVAPPQELLRIKELQTEKWLFEASIVYTGKLNADGLCPGGGGQQCLVLN